LTASQNKEFAMRARNNSSRLVLAAATLVAALTAATLWAQTFNSGSTGTDGNLIFPNAQPGQTIIFDPTTLNTPLPANHGNIYNFGTITIPAGVTLKLSAQNLGGPIYLLATGAVDIEGTVDLSGAPGYPPTTLISNRIPSIPGAGGFPGGVGGTGGSGSSYPVEVGQGPGGGTVNTSCGDARGTGGQFTANQFLVPLIGGSGGAGTDYEGGFGAGGGAGGGAILIASSISITINGTITAAGGNAGDNSSYYTAGGGAGGAVHLLAPTIQGNGSILVNPGRGGDVCGGPSQAQSGLARLEAFSQLFSGSINGGQASGTPYNTFVPTSGTVPQLTVVSVNGITVNSPPLGNFTTPDVTFNASGPVPVVINGQNIPSGTQVNLQIYSENGPDIVMPNAGALTTMSGTSTSVTVMVNLPPGFSRGFISASFNP
jgi:hypothetical protein